MSGTVGAVRPTADRGRCIGSGQCVLIAPDVFGQRPDDGTVVVLATPGPYTLAGVLDAVARCPVGALGLGTGSPS